MSETPHRGTSRGRLARARGGGAAALRCHLRAGAAAGPGSIPARPSAARGLFPLGARLWLPGPWERRWRKGARPEPLGVMRNALRWAGARARAGLAARRAAGLGASPVVGEDWDAPAPVRGRWGGWERWREMGKELPERGACHPFGGGGEEEGAALGIGTGTRRDTQAQGQTGTHGHSPGRRWRHRPWRALRKGWTWLSVPWAG